MTSSSLRRRPSSTPSLLASRKADLQVSIRGRVGRLRVAMVNNAPLGFQRRVADLMDWREQRPTREVTGVEKLSVELLLAEVELHRVEGRSAEAESLLALVNEGQAIHLSTDRAVVIRMKDGQMLLDFEAQKGDLP